MKRVGSLCVSMVNCNTLHTTHPAHLTLGVNHERSDTLEGEVYETMVHYGS